MAVGYISTTTFRKGSTKDSWLRPLTESTTIDESKGTIDIRGFDKGRGSVALSVILERSALGLYR